MHPESVKAIYILMEGQKLSYKLMGGGILMTRSISVFKSVFALSANVYRQAWACSVKFKILYSVRVGAK